MARPSNAKKHLIDKYYEIVWALSCQEEYRQTDIGIIMNRDRSVIKRAIAKKPKGWKPKWVKRQE